MAERNRPHILLRGRAEPEPYTRPPGGGDGGPLARPANPGAHAASLIAQLTESEDTATALRNELAEDLPRADGIFITFESFPEVELALQSLDPQLGQRHPELVAVRSVKTEEGIRQQATVFVPDGKLGYFLDRLQAYADTVDEPNPRTATSSTGSRRLGSPRSNSSGRILLKISPNPRSRSGGSCGYAAETERNPNGSDTSRTRSARKSAHRHSRSPTGP